MDCILAIDVGTQSVRACIVDWELSVLERQQVSYFPEVKSKGRVEIDAEVLWDALIQACRNLRRRNRVKAVTFSTLCPSLLPMDGNGDPLHPIILHLDRRSPHRLAYRSAIAPTNPEGRPRRYCLTHTHQRPERSLVVVLIEECPLLEL